MKVKSIGLKTNLFISSLLGQVHNRDGYIVVKTPTNPKFHWGNFVVMPSAPKQGDYDIWLSIFKNEFKDIEQVNHVLFVWDDPEGNQGQLEEFVRNGFEINAGIYLSADKVKKPPHFNSTISFREITDALDWKKLSEAHPEEYHKNQLISQKSFVEKGQGFFMGAFKDDELVADLGVFFNDSIGRFQNVSTKEKYRRQGICGTLVYHASNYSFDHFKAKKLIMEADEDYIAARIYESVGFNPIEKSMAISYSH